MERGEAGEGWGRGGGGWGGKGGKGNHNAGKGFFRRFLFRRVLFRRGLPEMIISGGFSFKTIRGGPGRMRASEAEGCQRIGGCV